MAHSQGLSNYPYPEANNFGLCSGCFHLKTQGPRIQEEGRTAFKNRRRYKEKD